MKTTNDSVSIRPMTLADVPLGMRLKGIAGWNQCEADWIMLLEAGVGFVAQVDGVAVGTATVVAYEAQYSAQGSTHFSWIGMLLVDPAYRRRDVGTTLLRATIDYAASLGPVYLDATPQGKPLYENLGFSSVGSLVRMSTSGQRSVINRQPRTFDGRVVNLDDDTLADVLRFDRDVFGANRSLILRTLRRNAPQYAHAAVWNGQITGYCLGRSGSDSDQIGPVVADDVDTACALLEKALHARAGHEVIVDVPLQREVWHQCLRDIGFIERRPFTRMVLGEPVAAGQPDKVFAIAGPEVG